MTVLKVCTRFKDLTSRDPIARMVTIAVVSWRPHGTNSFNSNEHAPPNTGFQISAGHYQAPIGRDSHQP